MSVLISERLTTLSKNRRSWVTKNVAPLFPPLSPHETGALLAAYLDTATAQLGTQSVPVGLQPCPLRMSGAGTLPSHSYFNADWGQRIRALASAVS